MALPEGDRKRRAPEGDRKRRAPEGDRKRRAPEGDRKRKAPEGDRKRKAPEGDRKRRAPEGDRKRKAPEGDRKRRRRERPAGMEIAARARDVLAEMTGLAAEGVTALEQEEDGTWRVTVELLELSRVPDTDDILGSYEVELDEDGQPVGYRRAARYPRSQAQPAGG
jgi:hypothetical protein